MTRETLIFRKLNFCERVGNIIADKFERSAIAEKPEWRTLRIWNRLKTVNMLVPPVDRCRLPVKKLCKAGFVGAIVGETGEQ